ncbi:MAG: deoxyribose-phosphate aldolase [Clostridiales Family XIII bacterium]|jgi:deoxyribose-phosphate aldolase|nr:deoxyribose-phosphate aldolase [Clostridiales Family XIII bacterium]
MELNQMIDHTLLKSDATIEDVLKLIDEAKEYNFKSVCINPTWVGLAHERLLSSQSEVCTVIGFPLGANTSETKAFEAKNAIENGADEVDMVINIGALKCQQTKIVEDDIKAVVDASNHQAIVKVIIETALLTKDEIILACELALSAGADFVKTSTGFSTGGATIDDVKLMKRIVGNELQVKASGGIHNYEEAIAMIEAGASRIGTSNGVAIMKGEQVNSEY